MGGLFAYPGTPSASPGSPMVFEGTFWAARSRDDWRRLLAVAQTTRFRPGEVALTAGEVPRGFHLVAFGRLRAGERAFEEGEPVGLGPAFGGYPMAEDVTADLETDLVTLTRDSLDVIRAREPELATDILFEFGRLLALEVRGR